MSGPFTSPTPWLHRNTGGTETVVDRTGQLVCILGRGFEAGNGALIVAAPALQEALRDFVDAADGSLERVERVFLQFYEETGLLAPGKSVPPEMHETEEKREERHRRWALWATKRRDAVLNKAKAALVKSEQDGGAPEDGPVETGSGL